MDVLRMSPSGSAMSAAAAVVSDDEMDLKRGPWTAEEDMLLANYIAVHGEGRWNSLARYAGLKRTGKSCRLRWLNYLRPDVRRGNITPEEQLLILELHSRWGNRWSKIAQHLPGRTDNEIKNYWRTRVQKHAKQLKCDVNSKQFRDVMRYVWMPRLVERIQADSAAANITTTTASSPRESAAPHLTVYQNAVPNEVCHTVPSQVMTMSPDSSSTLASSLEASIGASFPMNPVMTDHVVGWSMVQCGGETASMDNDMIHCDVFSRSWSELLAATGGDCSAGMPDFEFGEFEHSSWSLEDILLQQRF